MSEELEGQMSLFDTDEVCKYCGGHCTSSKECVEIEQQGIIEIPTVFLLSDDE
jgi:hypothetical protein